MVTPPFVGLPIFSALIQKGGTGKTTINYTFGEYSAIIKHKRVLIIDLDPQCNMSQVYLDMDYEGEGDYQMPPIHPEFDPNDPLDVQSYSPRSSIADIFDGKSVIPYETYINKENGFQGYLDIIPAHQSRLTDINSLFAVHSKMSELKSMSGHSYVKFAFKLSEFLRQPQITDMYDLVILDAGPTDNLFFRAVIYAATHIVCPYTNDDFSLRGVGAILNIAKDPKRQVSGFNSLNFLGILPSQVRGYSKEQFHNIKRNIEKYGQIHFPENVHVMFSDALSTRKNRDGLKTANQHHSVFSEKKSEWIKWEPVMEDLSVRVFA
jgi:cellulose biosynthesis protein BcsQ